MKVGAKGGGLMLGGMRGWYTFVNDNKHENAGKCMEGTLRDVCDDKALDTIFTLFLEQSISI